jgi:hypothetical protein
VTNDPRATRTRYAARALQAALAVIALWFAYRALRAQWTGAPVALGDVHPNWTWVALSGVIFLCTYAVLVETWREVLRAWNASLGFVAAARIWSVSNLGRYVPGKLWQIGAMGVMAERAGVSAVAATGSAILNVIVNLIAGLFVVAVFGWPLLRLQGASHGGGQAWIVFLAFCVAAVGLLPLGLPALLRTLSRLTKRDLNIGTLPPIAILFSLLSNVVAWLLYGAAFALFARGVLGSGQGPITAYIAVYALSYLVGYLVLFAPAGVGFREASMIALLPAAHLANPSQAAILAVTSRLWLTALEIAPGAIFLGVDSLRRRSR